MGNGMPYLVPACAFKIIGTRTIVLPRKMVTTACHQFIPSAISDEAIIYVGMHADIEIHKDAMSLTPHRLWAKVVGARSALT
jgi:hypothetical protein